MICNALKNERAPIERHILIPQMTVKQRGVEYYLVVSKPYPLVCDGECEDMVHKRLTLRVIMRCRKCLKQENHNEYFSAYMPELNLLTGLVYKPG